MIDIPAGWLAVFLLIAGALTGALAYLWKRRDVFYERYIDRLEAEILAGRLKTDALQNEARTALRAQLTDALNRTTVDRRVAASLETLVSRLPPP